MLDIRIYYPLYVPILARELLFIRVDIGGGPANDRSEIQGAVK